MSNILTICLIARKACSFFIFRPNVFIIILIIAFGEYISMEDLRLSGSIIRKSRFIFTKERRIIRQKSGCLSHSNERIFQVNIQIQWRIKDPGKGFYMHIRCWFRFVDFIIYLKYSMKMK